MSAPLASLAPVPDVADAFASALVTAAAARHSNRFSLMLSGGPTARRCYQRVAALAPGLIDWSQVDLYLGDERYVPADDPDANQRLVREALLEPLARADPAGTVPAFHPMPTDRPIDQCAAAYGETVRALLEGEGIDLVHLGLGPDGHTASLFPDAPSLSAAADQLVLATADPHARNPHARLTLTLPALDRAALAIFTVSGAEKRQALAAVRRGEDLPATRVRSARIRWLVDPAAFGAATSGPSDPSVPAAPADLSDPSVPPDPSAVPDYG